MFDNELLLNAFMESCRLLTKYNVYTNELYIYKDLQGKICNRQDPVDANAFLESSIRSGDIYEQDIPQMELLLNREYIRKTCEKHQNGTLAVYRRVSNGKLIWTRMNIYIPEQFSIENPFVVLFNRNMPEQEAIYFESLTVFTNQSYKTARINLTTDEYYNIKPFTAEENLQRNRLKIGDGFQAEIDFIRDHYVHPDDISSYSSYINFDYLRNYFKNNTEFRFYYRRRVKGLYRWVYLLIVPSSDYSKDNESFFFYVIDDHKTILKLLDIQSATSYAQYFSKKNKNYAGGYYENMLEIMSLFTEQYLDYYLIDLEKDLYFNYKLTSTYANKNIPSIGAYSQICREYLSDNYSDEEKDMLSKYSTPEHLRGLLKNRMTVDLTFTYPNGIKAKTTCIKMEAKNGIPTKVLCSTVPVKDDKKLIIRTFGNFQLLNSNETPLKISRKQSIELMAYLVDKQGYPVSSKDIVMDILEKDPTDMNAIKYVSTMIRRLVQELEAAGYPDLIIKESKSVRLNTDMVDCDYYHFLQGDTSYWRQYHNEYMKEYSWAEETNADLMNLTDIL